jgi:catechol 2,3-dioxygenase-like lactoylglutathione lyase family enzyme
VALVLLYAKDPDAAVQFFVNALGGHDAGHGVPMRSDRHVIVQGLELVFRPKHYQKYGWPGGLRGTNPDWGSKPMAVYLRFAVDDVAAAHDACLQYGAKAVKESGGVYQLSMTAVVRTPEGHLVELQGPAPATHPQWIRAKEASDERARLSRLLGPDEPEAYYFEDDEDRKPKTMKKRRTG